MRTKILMTGFALAVVLPSAAMAQETCEQRAQNRVAGTAVGAVAGALLGSAVSGHGHKTTGAIVGGVAGAAIGNQIAKGPKDCQHAYGWYDDGGRWHANAVRPDDAWGYYDRTGAWVEGRPADYRPVQYQAAPPAAAAWDDRGWRAEPGDPQFAAWEDRIHDQIRDGVRDRRIARDEARDLMGRLRDIRQDEARGYRIHHGRLPPEDRGQIRHRLSRLEHQVERTTRR
jgi:hypothetical protein